MVWSTELCARPFQERFSCYYLKQQRLLDSALSQTPFELRSFLLCNALFIPNRGKERQLSLGPRPIMFFFLFSSLTPPRGIERHRSLRPRPIIHFFLTPPCGPERHCSLGPRSILFFNATPWHRVTPLSRSETDLFFFFLTPPGAHNLLTPPRGTERHCFLRPPQPVQQAFPYGLGAKNDERESKTTRKNGASKREGSGHPVAQSDTAFSDRD